MINYTCTCCNLLQIWLKEIYSDNIGESFDDVARSIATVESITGASGEALKGMTNNALLMRDTFEFDVTESVRAADMMVRQFGISGNIAYSMIAQGAQSGLDKNGDLLDSINEYSVHFKNLGFSADEMFNMMANGAKSGTFSVDKLGDTIKEFGIRSKDGSEGTAEAFLQLGLNSDKMADAFARGGNAGKKAFEEVTKRLYQMKDPLQQDAVGVALFGTMWEDLQKEGIFALTNVQGSIAATADALETINNIQYNDIGSALGSLGRTIQTDIIIPIGQQAMPAISTAINNTKTAISEFGAGLAGAADVARTPLYELGSTFAVVGEIAGGTLAFITEHANIVIPPLIGMVTVMGVLKTITLATAAANKIKTAILLADTLAVQGATAVQWLFNAAIGGFPAWVVVLGIGAIIAALVGLYNFIQGKLGNEDKQIKFGFGADKSGLEETLKSTEGLEAELNLKPEMIGSVGDFGIDEIDASYNASPEQLNTLKGISGSGGSSSGGSGSFGGSGSNGVSSGSGQIDSKTRKTNIGKPSNFGQDISGFNDSELPENYKMGYMPTSTDSTFPQNATTAQTKSSDMTEYSPEKTKENIINNITNNDNFHYNPIINVDVNGTKDDKDLQKKIVIVVKKELRDTLTAARNKHPRLIEA